MDTMTVNVSLYGELAQIREGRHVSNYDIVLNAGATIGELMAVSELPAEKKGFTFVNAVLYDMPGLSASLNEPLKHGDHVGIFSTGYIWPYQYRDGIRMSDSLTAELREHGAMHHIYKKNDPSEQTP